MKDIAAIRVIHYETGKPVLIEIDHGLISGVTEMTFSPESRNLFAAPGLIDNQVNGYTGVDFSDPGLTPERMKTAVDAIRKDGVTTFMPTVITNSHENLLRNFRNLAAAIKNETVRESVMGFHLEGPYISPVEGFYGCHPAQFIRNPSWKEFAEYQEAADGKIVQVTLAPETEGAMEFIAECRKNNIIVSLGHTNASAEQINMAASLGARLSTHLGNGCANLIDRHRNPLWPQLANEQLTPTIIADGHHLLPEEIKVFYKVKGPAGLILTSDVNHLKGMPPGKYIYFGSEVVYTDDGLVKNPVLNCLAGASMPLRKGVETVMEYTGCSLKEAINMATRNVSEIYGLNDRGVIETGKRADLVLFELQGGKILIKQVLLNGINV
ncbi:MAG: N-acetylglucosamine-6-phosphate deacetylase [Bacteroidota bacterium]|nr:N-acetylglucosamine-6-phosphate deacetylase [Bacteroidota bacterium]